MVKQGRVTSDPQGNVYPSSALSHGKTDEILGRVQHSRVVITITRYGKPIARIVPIDDPSAVVTDPTSKINPTSPTTER
jgi:prevent-host-death family protein